MSQNPISGTQLVAKGAILVVDDEPKVLDLVVRLLRRVGHTAIACSTPTELLDKLKETRVGVVLSDISMPEMSGFELMHQVHRQQPTLPVVLMTGGQLDPELTPIALEFGAFALLQKPFQASLLWSTIDSALGSSPSLQHYATI